MKGKRLTTSRITEFKFMSYKNFFLSNVCHFGFYPVGNNSSFYQ